MMVIFCDICGEQATKPYLVRYNVGERDQVINEPFPIPLSCIDICEKCHEKWRDTINEQRDIKRIYN